MVWRRLVECCADLPDEVIREDEAREVAERVD
jgi:hypothetical protein